MAGRALAQRNIAASTNEIAAAFGATPEVYAVVKSQIAPPNTPDEVVALYFARCKQTGSDPMGRMLYIINRPNKNVDNWRIEATIDFFRAQAEATGEYAGQEDAQWCGDDGVWTDAWLRSTPPAAARVGVLRRGFHQPLRVVARYSAYYGPTSNNYLKGTMPEVLIAKVAEMGALRKAFPQRLNGIYGAEEMEQANDARTVTNATITQDGSVSIASPTQAALPAALPSVDPPEKRTLADMKRLFAELQAEGETRTNGQYLSACQDRWLKPGAKTLGERARGGAVTFAEAEIDKICAVMEDDLVQRKTFVQEPDLPGADDTEHKPECTCPDDGDEFHRPECPANEDVQPPDIKAAYEADASPMDPALEAAPDANGTNPPTREQIDTIHAELKRAFGRSESKKTAWLEANSPWSSPGEVEFADHAEVLITHLKELPDA